MQEDVKYNFCTLFDKGFLNRGLALYNSLLNNIPEQFSLFILCMDDITYDILNKMNLDRIKLIKLEDFEDEELKKAKANRNWVEYCWTLSPSLPLYIIETFNVDMITYLDADLFFYSSPEPIYREFTNSSIMLIPHRFTLWKKDKEKEVGKYNVGMLIFKNDEDGLACLRWWREKCNEWCYEKVEPHRYGDQKYLDCFPDKFKGVYILNNKGANLAYWNIRNYTGKIKKNKNKIFIDNDELVFFHFSQFKVFYPKKIFLPNGPFNNYTKISDLKNIIYKKYFKALYQAMKDIRKISPNFEHGVSERPALYNQVIEIITPHIKNFIRGLIN